jgi:hypothetical protein
MVVAAIGDCGAQSGAAGIDDPGYNYRPRTFSML